MDNIEKVWQVYGTTKDPALKEKLILEYAPLIKYVAGRLSIHIGTHVEYEELVSYGIFGLIDAIDKFKYEKGVKFETYASLRIRGAIIDSIRKMDWVPRTLRQKNKQLEQVYQSMEASLGREPTDEEVALQMNVSVDEIREMTKKASVVSLISLDDYLEQNHEGNYSGNDPTQPAQTEDPESTYERKELRSILEEAIEKLSEKEKKVIMLYYFEELTLKEISHIMGVSESRISQIHSKAVFRLQTRLGRYKSILFVT